LLFIQICSWKDAKLALWVALFISISIIIIIIIITLVELY